MLHTPGLPIKLSYLWILLPSTVWNPITLGLIVLDGGGGERLLFVCCWVLLLDQGKGGKNQDFGCLSSKCKPQSILTQQPWKHLNLLGIRDITARVCSLSSRGWDGSSCYSHTPSLRGPCGGWCSPCYTTGRHLSFWSESFHSACTSAPTHVEKFYLSSSAPRPG